MLFSLKDSLYSEQYEDFLDPSLEDFSQMKDSLLNEIHNSISLIQENIKFYEKLKGKCIELDRCFFTNNILILKYIKIKMESNYQAIDILQFRKSCN